jgi:hypothetical protein
MRVKLLIADADGRQPGAIVTMADADVPQAAARGQVIPLGEATIAVRFTQTVEPTPTNPTRYDHGSVWQVPESEAWRLVEAGIAELTDGDAPAAPQNFSLE